jgi:hypothetical protein
LAEKPFYEPVATRELPTDDRGPESYRIRVIDFPHELRSSVEILGVRMVAFLIVTGSATEHTISADMDQSGSDKVAEARKPMRQEGIDGNCNEWVLGSAQLLHDTDAVDDDIGTDISQNGRE